MATLADRFEAKVDRSGEHHLWQGSTRVSGTGQVRVDGQLHNAPRVAWELANGPLSDGAGVKSCPDEPRCVNTNHLRIAETPKTARAIRSDSGSGSVRQVGENRWKLTIDVGRDRQGRRRRISRTIRGTRTDANRAMAALSVEVQEGKRVAVDKRTGLTVDGLMEHLAAMDARAAACELAVPDAFVFSIEPDCSAPMQPELMTRTELMDAGFNPTAVSSRQGHIVQVMLNNYSSRRASADQAAADHLGAAVFGEPG